MDSMEPRAMEPGAMCPGAIRLAESQSTLPAPISPSASLEGPQLPGPLALSDLLRAEVASKPDSEALVSGRERWTWRGLEDAATNLAGNLLALGLKPGDRVASLMPNRTALVIHYLACIKAGLVCVPLNYRYTVPDVEHALELSCASLLVAHAERLGELDASRVVHHLPHGIVIHEGAASRRPRLANLMIRRSAAAAARGQSG